MRRTTAELKVLKEVQEGPGQRRFMAVLTSSAMVCPFRRPLARFSRMRSKTTMVSLMSSPRWSGRAAQHGQGHLALGQGERARVTMTSWAMAPPR